MHTIILRTVCGCERMLAIPNRTLPREYRVPYVQQNHRLLTFNGVDDLPTHTTVQVRVFGRTCQSGNYGYPVYLEVLE